MPYYHCPYCGHQYLDSGPAHSCGGMTAAGVQSPVSESNVQVQQELSDLQRQVSVLITQVLKITEILMAMSKKDLAALEEKENPHDMTRLHNDVDHFLRGFYGVNDE